VLAETLEELELMLRQMAEALRKPVLDFETLKELSLQTKEKSDE